MVLCKTAEAYAEKGDRAKAKEYWDKTARFNEKITMDYALVRKLALKKLDGLK